MKDKPLGLVFEICQTDKGVPYVLTMCVLTKFGTGLIFGQKEEAGAFLIAHLSQSTERV